MVGDADRPPRTTRSLRFCIVGTRRAARLYSASEIDVLATDDAATDPRLARLGPDALHRSTTPGQIAERLRSRTFRGRHLGGLLLDQGFVAGLGNYLRSDILHASGVHPRRRPKDLPDEIIASLAANIVQLCRRSYRTRGITNTAQRVTALRARGLPRARYRHLAYAREGEPCYECQAPIERIEMSRAVFVCPRCQPSGA